MFPNGSGNVEIHQHLEAVLGAPPDRLRYVGRAGEKDEKGQPILEAKYGFHALRHAAACSFNT